MQCLILYVLAMIAMAYISIRKNLPLGVRTHCINVISSAQVGYCGDICATASWISPTSLPYSWLKVVAQSQVML